MKLKAAKPKESPVKSPLVTKKTKATITKTKPAKKELKSSVKTAIAGVAPPTPLTFAEKKVLSVKRKSVSSKTPGDQKTSVKLPKKEADKKSKTEPKHKNVVAKGKPDQKAGAGPKATAVLPKGKPGKKAGTATKASVVLPKGNAVNQSKPGPKSNVVLPKAKENETEPKSPRHQKVVARVEERMRKLQKQEQEEGGTVATEVTEEVLALVPKELISRQGFQKCFETMHTTVDKQGNKLFGDDLKYELQIVATKVPQVPSRNCRVSLPNPVRRDEDEVCLIVRDLERGRNVDFLPTLYHWEDKLKELGVTAQLQVIPFQKLKKDFVSFELKRKLALRYDRFLVDARISGHVFAFLGSQFTRRCKNPIPVKLDVQDQIKTRIEKAMLLQTYSQSNIGNTTCIKFAAHWMPVEQSVENGMALLEKLKTIFPGGWLNILSLHLKTVNEKVQSLPLYISLIDPNLIPTPSSVGPVEKFITKQQTLLKKRTAGAFEVTDSGVVRKARKRNADGEELEESDEDLIVDEYEKEMDDDWLPYDGEKPSRRKKKKINKAKAAKRSIKIRAK